MSDTPAENAPPPAPAGQESAKRPLHRWVMRTGKRLTRWLGRYQGRQGLVPDAPFVGKAHFPFLASFEDRLTAAAAKANENLEKLSEK